MKGYILNTAAALTVVTAVSKFVGLFREISLAYLFGTTLEMDAYLVALIIPVLVFESFGEALRLSFIPVTADYINNEDSLWLFFNNLINIIFVLTLAVSLIGVFAVPHIMPYLPFGFDEDGMRLTIQLTQIVMFMIVFTSLAPISGGLLNLRNVFVYPELTGIIYSIVLIVFAFLGAKLWGIGGLAAGTVFAEMAKFIFLLPALYKQGFRYRLYLNLRDPALRKLVGLMLPIIFGSILSRINVFVERMVGSYLLPGSISALNYAKKLLLLCSGFIESIVVTLIFPILSKHHVTGNKRQYKALLARTVNILIVVLVPCTAGIILLREPIIQVFFERGAFDRYAVLMTSTALFFYSLGILGTVFESLLERSFFAVKDTRTPVLCSSAGITINIVLNLMLAKFLGHGGIALAASAAASISAALMFVSMYRMQGYLGVRRTAVTLFKALTAALLMFAGLSFLNHVLVVNEIIKLAVLALSGVVIYFCTFIVLDPKQIVYIKKVYKRRSG